jgi:mRNA interferase MazF
MNRGDVVLANIRYSDQTGAKVRPAVVVSSDKNNAVLDDVILAAVSRFTRPAAFTHVFLDPATADGKAAGVLHPSYIQCENLFAFDQRLILKTLGRVSASALQQINACLKAALELP